MKFYAFLSNLIFLTKETATAVGGGNHPIVNLFNWAIDWTVIIVVPAGTLSLIINSILMAIPSIDYKPTGRKVYFWTLLSMAVGIGAKVITMIWNMAIRNYFN